MNINKFKYNFIYSINFVSILTFHLKSVYFIYIFNFLLLVSFRNYLFFYKYNNIYNIIKYNKYIIL